MCRPFRRYRGQIGRDTRLSAVYGPSAGHTSALFFVFALYLMMMENDVV